MPGDQKNRQQHRIGLRRRRDHRACMIDQLAENLLLNRMWW